MQNLFLTGEKIYLRPLKEGDEVVAARAENHPDPRAHLYIATPTSVEKQKEKLLKLDKDHHAIILTICTIDPDQAIGITEFVRIDWIGRMATFYITIADKANWNRGYGREATKLMVDYAFNTLNLNRIQLHVSVENERAVKVYREIGFKIEGTLREAMYFDGCYHDFFLMALLKNEWLKRSL